MTGLRSLTLATVFSTGILLLLVGCVVGDDMRDVYEGDNVLLECRFAPHLISGKETLYWSRTNTKDNEKDNVAIGNTPLEMNYDTVYHPSEGRYDLRIVNATYDRDNGRFECRIKASGSGAERYSKIVQLTVLLPPGAPKITPNEPSATEGRPLELSCGSSGGSPDPLIRWYRTGLNYPLDSIVKNGGSRGNETTAILSVTPARDDDGTEYRCVVWNRALGEGVKLEKTVSLNVNYFPRVKVGPENPLRVERGEGAKLHCSVDSKPAVSSVRWTRNGKFSETSFGYTLPRISLSDAGTYVCSAENGLGQSGEADLSLDVLYAPIVSLTPSKEYGEGETAWIKCNVSSNPKPSQIEWMKKDEPGFHHYGDILKIESLSAASAGTYICKATNVLNPSGDRSPYERTGNASVVLLIKHSPGKTIIEPNEPTVVEGSGVTLSCRADPPGWPTPQYRWWKDGSDATLSVGPQLNIGSAKVGSEGKYFCQPTNEVGSGTMSSVHLKVFQPPRITHPLVPNTTRRTGETNFSISCSGTGVPKPRISWVKNGAPLERDALFKSHYTVVSKDVGHEGRSVQSTLFFNGDGRDGIVAEDRGYYVCVFENEVKREESHMYIRIQHKPIFRQKHDIERVAYDINDIAGVPCRVQAFPKPEFDWFYNSVPIVMDGKNYETNLTTLQNDIFVSTLFIKGVRGSEDYGEYTCRAMNPMGNSTGVIKLQPRGPPSAPSQLEAIEIGVSSVLLNFNPGFNGGFENTKYYVSYYSEHNTTPTEFHCSNYIPCNVTGLEQKTIYVFKIKAHNGKGSSEYSPSVTVVTRVDLGTIPDPIDVKFEPKSGTLLFNQLGEVPIHAKVEVQDETGVWRKYRMILVDTPHYRTLISEQNSVENVRVTNCVDDESCGRTVDAVLVSDVPAVAPVGVRVHYMVAGVVSGIVLLLCLALIFIFCCCRRRKKTVKKEYESGRGHQSQVVPPPPPYYNSGMENKGLQRSMDIIEDTIKNLHPNPYISYNQTNGNGNIPYIDQNSYSNSNNGGSVDSEDSLWKVANVPHEQMSSHHIQHEQMGSHHMPHEQMSSHHMPHDQMSHHLNSHQRNNYEHYGPPDESYAPYETSHTNNYSSDPYGPIPKPKRRLDLIGEHSGYDDLSGLPDPYLINSHSANESQKVPMSFEESLESGYSTPSSRNRRVIREIIV